MSRPARIPRQRADLIRALREQRELLQNAADRYDTGSEVEAKNLALRVRVLLHDSRSSHSLLGQLGIKEVLPYLDTTNPDPPPGVLHFDAGLCMIHGVTGPDGHSRYLPALTNMDPERWHPPQAFVDWWSAPVVSDNSGAPVSRSEFVLWLANEDGGAHVDPSVKDAYHQLSGVGLDTFRPEHGDDPRFKDLVAPSVRQIAFELEKTLEASISEDAGELCVEGVICSLPIATKVEAGRNDPCPCGSESKMKVCFGRRLPRRQMRSMDLGDPSA